MARGFIQLQVKVTICKHIIQIIKKIAKLDIGLYCSTKFRIESKNIDYSTCGKSLERNFVCTYKQAKLMHLILYTARRNIFILAHEKNYLKKQQYK